MVVPKLTEFIELQNGKSALLSAAALSTHVLPLSLHSRDKLKKPPHIVQSLQKNYHYQSQIWPITAKFDKNATQWCSFCRLKLTQLSVVFNKGLQSS